MLLQNRLKEKMDATKKREKRTQTDGTELPLCNPLIYSNIGRFCADRSGKVEKTAKSLVINNLAQNDPRTRKPLIINDLRKTKTPFQTFMKNTPPIRANRPANALTIEPP